MPYYHVLFWFHCTPDTFILFQTPFDSLPGYKNPCWISKIDSDSVYNRNARSPWKFHKQLGQVYDERMRKDGFRWRMRCFPYFMLIGVSKCGTTDLFARIRMHPEIFGPTVKEIRFWNRQRIGRLRLSGEFEIMYLYPGQPYGNTRH